MQNSLFCFWGGGIKVAACTLRYWLKLFFSFRFGKSTALSKYHKSIESVMRSIGSKRRLALASSTYKGRYQCFLSFELQKYPVSPRFPCQYGTIPTKTLNVSNVLPEFYIPPESPQLVTSILQSSSSNMEKNTSVQSQLSHQCHDWKNKKVKPGLWQEKTVTRRWPL